VIQTSGIPLAMADSSGNTLAWAMQVPEPVNLPRGGATASFLDSFLRGNRDTEDRRGVGSISQVLNMMNDTIVYTRARASGTGATASLARNLLTQYPQPAGNSGLVQDLFLAILSRGPNPNEVSASLLKLGTLTGTARQQAVEDLTWSLYNKVDFLYNY
jgi:hypothetical protein